MHRTSSVFYLSDYSIRRPISSILQFFSDLKCCLDRIRKGYCEKDLWEIDTWFLNVMPEMFQTYFNDLWERDNRNSPKKKRFTAGFL